MKIIRGKIKISKIADFYKKQLPVIIFFLLLTHAFIQIRALPYFNLIPHYYFYVTGIYFIIFLLIYRKQLLYRRILIGIEILLLFALIASLSNTLIISEMIGFLIVTLLFTIMIIAILTDRKSLKFD